MTGYAQSGRVVTAAAIIMIARLRGVHPRRRPGDQVDRPRAGLRRPRRRVRRPADARARRHGAARATAPGGSRAASAGSLPDLDIEGEKLVHGLTPAHGRQYGDSRTRQTSRPRGWGAPRPSATLPAWPRARPPRRVPPAGRRSPSRSTSTATTRVPSPTGSRRRRRSGSTRSAVFKTLVVDRDGSWRSASSPPPPSSTSARSASAPRWRRRSARSASPATSREGSARSGSARRCRRCVDATALEHETVFVSAGRRGLRDRARAGRPGRPDRRRGPPASALSGAGRRARPPGPTSTREETPSFWNRLRRCVSTVLRLRNSSAGDLGVGPAVDHEPCDLQLALGQRLDAPRRPRCPAACGGAGARAELAQLALGLVPARTRAAGVEVGRPRARSSAAARSLLAGLRRAPGPRACAPAHPRPGPQRRRPRRRRRAPASRPRARRRAPARRRPPRAPRHARPRQGELLGQRLRRGGGALGLLASVEREPGAREQLAGRPTATSSGAGAGLGPPPTPSSTATAARADRRPGAGPRPSASPPTRPGRMRPRARSSSSTLSSAVASAVSTSPAAVAAKRAA